MKKLVSDFFALFGVGLYKIKKVEEKQTKPEYKPVKDFEVTSAFDHNTAQRMNDFFSDPEHVENYISDVRVEFYNQIVEYFNKNNIDLNDKEVLDVGCGTGHLLMYLSDHYKMRKVYGMDFSEAAISIAKQNLPDGEFKVHNIYESHNKKYDIVLCTEVLEHLIDPEIALSNLEKMMKENSLLYITTPNGRTDTYKGHINYWGPEGWEIFFKKNCNLKNIKTGLLVDSRFNYASIKSTE